MGGPARISELGDVHIMVDCIAFMSYNYVEKASGNWTEHANDRSIHSSEYIEFSTNSCRTISFG